MQTIEEAKAYLKENWKKGVKCPCCNQLCMLYDRKIDRDLSLSLIKIYKLQQDTGKSWVHVQNELKFTSGNYGKLRFWGLLVPRGDEPEKDTKTSGYWSITELGKKFVNGKVSIPKSVLVYDNKKYGQSDKLVTIQEALGKKFSWSELMGDYLLKDEDTQQGKLL